MSNAIKCDRCGACYEYGGMTVGEEYDLCDGCVADFEAWMECQPVTGAPERVTESAEMSHDTGGSGYRYHIIRDGMIRMVVKGSDLKDTDVVESVEEPDTREKLEAEMAEYLEYDWYMLAPGLLEKMSGWLDRQAAITERDMLDEMQHVFVPDPADITKRDERIAELKAKLDAEAQHAREAWQLWGEADARAEQAETERDELQREIATLKEHRAANMEKLHELTDECAELRKYRDEWKGIAEAAWAECEGYRAKLGAVLDAIREAERAAR